MEILNPEGHSNHITGSKVKTILLNGWILPIGGASAVRGLCLQPAQQACLVSPVRAHLLQRSIGSFSSKLWSSLHYCRQI